MLLPNNDAHRKNILLIDVSNLFFRAFHAVPAHFRDKKGNPSNAVYGVVSVLLGILERSPVTHIFAAKDVRGGTFRHKEIDAYKAGRPKMPEELAIQLPLIFDFFENALKVPLLSHEGMEADDIIATVAEFFRKKDGVEVSILSADHDLFQLVGENITVLLPQNGGRPAAIMTPEEVHKKMGVFPEKVTDYKSMAGDSSDNLAGVPGIGPKGACRILETYGTLEKALKKVDEIPGKNGRLLKEYAEQAVLTKKMATLIREVPIAIDEKQARIPASLTPSFLHFLENISSRSLMTRAKKIFGAEKMEKQISLF